MTLRRTRFGIRGTCIHCKRKFEYRNNMDETSASEHVLKRGADSEYICEECQQRGLSGKPGTQGQYGFVPIRIKSIAEIDFSHPEVLQKLEGAYKVAADYIRVKEAAGFDFSQHKFDWKRDDRGSTWYCYAKDDRGSVYPSTGRPGWQACIEVPHQFKRLSPMFDEFSAAVAWVEAGLVSIPAADKEDDKAQMIPAKHLTLSTLTASHRRRLKRYWIEPKDLDVNSLTFRSVIHLRHRPMTYKTLELSFGEQLPYDEKYPTILHLAKTMSLDANDIQIEPLDNGYFNITSLLTYKKYQTASDFLFQVRKTSRIGDAIRSKSILEVRYGIQEVETEYIHWEAWEGDRPPMEIERTRFLEQRAFRLTLCYALDVTGYKSFLGYDTEYPTDTDILHDMHQERARSKLIPQSARMESEQWLRKHGYKVGAHTKW